MGLLSLGTYHAGLAIFPWLAANLDAAIGIGILSMLLLLRLLGIEEVGMLLGTVRRSIVRRS